MYRMSVYSITDALQKVDEVLNALGLVFGTVLMAEDLELRRCSGRRSSGDRSSSGARSRT